MLLLKLETKSDQGFQDFVVIHYRKCHLSDTGYMKYFTKYKDILPDDPKLKDTWDIWVIALRIDGIYQNYWI